MNEFIKTILARPVGAVVCVLALIIFGVSTLTNMELERLPESSTPEFFVSASYANVSPEEMDRLVTSKLEKACGSLKGFKSINSSSGSGDANITIEYDYGTDLKAAKEELQNVINSAKASLPKGVEVSIDEFNNNDESIFEACVLTDDPDIDVSSYVKQDIEPKFKNIEGVAKVEVNGGKSRYISIELSPDAVAQYGLDVSAVANIISGASFVTPAGTVSYGDQTINVSTMVSVSDIDDIKNVPIKLGSGDVIHLYDIATISFRDVPQNYYYTIDGKDGIQISIKKSQKANVVTVGNQIRSVVEDAIAENPDLEIITIKDNSIPIQKSIQNIFYTLLLGIILSMVVLFLFFGDLKASLIVGSSMPISLFVTFILMGRMGYTLNLVTMSALVIGIGMMVDNAIVVLEMCFVKKDEGYDFREAAFEGTKFIFTDIIASTLTSVVVYLPLVNLKGMAGQQFAPLGWTIMFALIASLASALTLVPLAFSRYKPIEKKTLWINRVLEKMGGGYAKIMPHLLKHRFIVAGVSLVLVAGSAYLFTDFMFDTTSYSSDYNSVSIMLTFKPGQNVEFENEVMNHYEQYVQKDENIKYYYSYVSPGSGFLLAELRDDIEVSPDDVGAIWSMDLEGYDDRCDAVVGFGWGSGGPEAQVPLYAENYDELKDSLAKIEEVARRIDGVTNVKNAFHSGGFKADVVIDQEMALSRGFDSIKDLSDTISAQIQGVKAMDVIVDDVSFEAKVEMPENMRSDLGNIETMSFKNSDGAYIPFSDVAHIEYTNVPQYISKAEGKYSGTISASCSAEDIYRIQEELTNEVMKMNLPKGVTLHETKGAIETREAMSETTIAIAASVFLVFMVMAIQFESIRYSLLVMLCLPFSLIGAMPLLYAGLSQRVINLSTMVGLLMLGGIVVNDGIMYVDTTNEYRKSMPLNDALILAGRSRMRPILMTTLTTVLSMIPMIIPGAGGDPAMRGLAYVVIGGLTMATILTLIILPIFYLFICKKDDVDKAPPGRRKGRRIKRRKTKTRIKKDCDVSVTKEMVSSVPDSTVTENEQTGGEKNV